MNTFDRLQKHLATEVNEWAPGYFYKKQAVSVKCADGTTLSVQASKYHYCAPKEHHGPYVAVEVWCIRNCPSYVIEFDYSDEGPSAYVPIEDVVRFINNHGGMIN